MIAPFSQYMGDRRYWAKMRWEYLSGARECREAVTRHDGLYAYPANDERVAAAVAWWVDKARNAHAFALGRKPIIPNAIVMASGAMSIGGLYAQEAA